MKDYLLIAVAVLVLWVLNALLAGCTNTISLAVSLPADSTPTLVEPQPPQAQHDSFDL